MTGTITIIDYGMGNIHSIASALSYIGISYKVASEPGLAKKSDVLILPGVGSFNKAMCNLKASGLDDVVQELVLYKKKKILGICLGFQLLAESGTEDGFSNGLGLIGGSVNRLSSEQGLKVPQVGFNTVYFKNSGTLFKGFDSHADFYFVNSFCLDAGQRPGHQAVYNYGGQYLGAYECDNVFGTQFHPEKSQGNGLKLLENFLK